MMNANPSPRPKIKVMVVAWLFAAAAIVSLIVGFVSVIYKAEPEWFSITMASLFLYLLLMWRFLVIIRKLL